MLRNRRGIWVVGLPVVAIAVWLAVNGGPATDGTVAAETVVVDPAEAELRQAAESYLAVAAQPGSDRAKALVSAGECYEQLDEPAESLACYNQVLAFDKRSYWAEISLARKADLSFQQADSAAAKDCIATLEAMFPESPWTVQARITAAKLTGGDVAAAEAAYTREVQAFDAYREGLRRTETDDQFQAMEAIITGHPDTATAIQAYRSKACLLWKKGRNEEAIAPWLAVLERTAATSPKSHIVAGARLHLASLYRKMKRYNDADSVYAALVSNAPGPELAAQAAYCRIAMDFAQMRADRRAGRPVDEQTATLVNRCEALADDEKAAELERVRAATLVFEILAWGKQPRACIDAADAFIQAHSGTKYTDEVALAHFYAGCKLLEFDRDMEALPHFLDVIELTAGQKSLQRTDSIPRSHYHAWLILRATGAPAESLAAVADSLYSAFPESDYSRAIRIIQRRDQEDAQK